MTTGRKFSKRTRDVSTERVLDHRTRTILNAVANESAGKKLSAYLRAFRSE